MEYEQTEDIGFSEVVTEKYRKKAYEVDFTVQKLGDIQSAQASAASHVAGILGITLEQATALLRSYKWNKERLVERYMDNSQEILDHAGVDLNDTRPRVFKRSTNFLCEICYDESKQGVAVGLRCQHSFCPDCYDLWLTSKIIQEGECRKIPCPAADCKVFVDERTIREVVPPHVLSRYQQGDASNTRSHKLRTICPTSPF